MEIKIEEVRVNGNVLKGVTLTNVTIDEVITMLGNKAITTDSSNDAEQEEVVAAEPELEPEPEPQSEPNDRHEEATKKSNKNCRSVIITDLETGEEKEYSSQKEAAKALDTQYSTISRLIRGDKPYLGRFQVISRALIAQRDLGLSDNSKGIVVLDMRNLEEHSFDSMKDAADFLGISEKEARYEMRHGQLVHGKFQLYKESEYRALV